MLWVLCQNGWHVTTSAFCQLLLCPWWLHLAGTKQQVASLKLVVEASVCVCVCWQCCEVQLHVLDADVELAMHV